MLSRSVASSVCVLLLCGCDLFRSFLPERGTTVAEAQQALDRCGVSSDAIVWGVSKDGTFYYGRKSVDAAPLTYRESQCVISWANDHRIKMAFSGNEQSQ